MKMSQTLWAEGGLAADLDPLLSVCAVGSRAVLPLFVITPAPPPTRTSLSIKTRHRLPEWTRRTLQPIAPPLHVALQSIKQAALPRHGTRAAPMSSEQSNVALTLSGPSASATWSSELLKAQKVMTED